VTRSPSWIPANEPVAVAGHRIAGGLIYVGHSLRSAAGSVEPAQINPALPVDPQAPGRAALGLAAAPSYHLISSGHRAAYLAWLAAGRTGSDVPIGLVVLFCSGLERRVLVDAAADPTVRAELPVIATELQRLQAVYGAAHPSFGQQADALLEVLDLLTAPARWPGPAGRAVPPPVATDAPRWPVPLALRIALAQLANAGRPMPPQWARCWAWYHPSLFPAAPQTRCPEEFTDLFALRYRRRLPAGLVPDAEGRPPVRIGYQPVNPAMDTVAVERPDLPDMLAEPVATRLLGTLVDEVTGALTPYSRWLARTPGGRASVASTMLLPDDLLDHRPGPLRPLMSWADDRLGGASHAVVDAAEFAPFWSSADPRGMSREEASSLAVVLARIGLGVEPDVRFAGPPLGPGPAVLFRLDPQASGSRATERPSAGYRSACLLLAVAAASVLARTDRTVPPDAATEHDIDHDTVNRTVTALAAEIRLTVDERTRLCARLRWLLASRVDPARVRRRAEALTPAERDAGGHFLLRLATECAPVGPDVVAALTEGYRLLALPQDQLFHRLHQALTADAPPGSAAPSWPAPPARSRSSRLPSSPASASSAAAVDSPQGRGPVLVRRGRPDTGHALPWASTEPAASTTVPVRPSPTGPVPAAAEPPAAAAGHRPVAGPVPLRPAVLDRRITETEGVTALLAGIFTADDDPAHDTTAPDDPDHAAGRPGTGAPDPGAVPGLDAAHGSILTAVSARSTWSGTEFAALAAERGVLPVGALDVINEAAITLTGQPAIEGDDPLSIDDAVVREMLG
jgi:TerB N-terminal domain/TerB-C domain